MNSTTCPAQGWLPAHYPHLGSCPPGMPLWAHYLSIGGSMSLHDFDLVLQGWPATSTGEHNLVVQTLNEHLLEHGEHFPLPYLHA